MQEAHATAHAEQPENHVRIYGKTILVLSGLTALEFLLAWMVKPGSGEPIMGFVLGVILLCALAVWKAVLVGRVFMHLKYDPRLLSICALTPVILGIPLVIIGLIDGRTGVVY